MQYIKAIIKKLNYWKNSKHSDNWWKNQAKKTVCSQSYSHHLLLKMITKAKPSQYWRSRRSTCNRQDCVVPENIHTRQPRTKDILRKGGRGSKRRRYPRGRRWHRLKYSASAFLTEIFFPGDIQTSGKIMEIPGVMGNDKYTGLGRLNKSAFGRYGYFLEISISPCKIKMAAFWKTCSHLTISRKNRAWRTV